MKRHDPFLRPTTRPAALALAASLLLALAACGGGPGGGGTTTGALAVDVTGLPGGTAANVAVTGPGGFSDALTGDETLTDLAVGSYTVAADPIDAPVPAGATYDPVVPSQSAAVVAGATTDVTVEYDLHECVAYQPTVGAGEDLSATWTATGAAGDVVDAFTVPGDAGGGYVRFVLDAPDGVRPSLEIDVLPLASGAIYAASADPADSIDTTRIEVVFEVAAGRSYQVRMRAANAESSVAFPQGFSADWTFESRYDCYEGNDTLATAKAIPMNATVEGHLIAGFRDANNVTSGGDTTRDFYRFELHETTTVRVALEQVPANARSTLVLYRENGSQVLASDINDTAAGDDVVLPDAQLAAGWYVVRVATPLGIDRVADLSRTTEPTTPPAHFLAPYQLTVTALD